MDVIARGWREGDRGKGRFHDTNEEEKTLIIKATRTSISPSYIKDSDGALHLVTRLHRHIGSAHLAKLMEKLRQAALGREVLGQSTNDNATGQIGWVGAREYFARVFGIVSPDNNLRAEIVSLRDSDKKKKQALRHRSTGMDRQAYGYTDKQTRKHIDTQTQNTDVQMRTRGVIPVHLQT